MARSNQLAIVGGALALAFVANISVAAPLSRGAHAVIEATATLKLVEPAHGTHRACVRGRACAGIGTSAWRTDPCVAEELELLGRNCQRSQKDRRIHLASSGSLLHQAATNAAGYRPLSRHLRCMSLQLACAVERRRFPVDARPTRQPLQPEAIGAVMEVTKWLKPSFACHESVTARVCRPPMRMNAEQASKRT
jgi:hypothetical protein